MSKFRQYIEATKVTTEWVCCKCGKLNTCINPSISIEGGCQGHGTDEYCYCSNSEVNTDTECDYCHLKATVKLLLYL